MRPALLLAASLLVSASAYAEDNGVSASASVTPTLGQSTITGESAGAIRYEVGAEGQIRRFRPRLLVGMTHLLASSGGDVTHTATNTTDPIYRETRVSRRPPGGLVLADTVVGAGFATHSTNAVELVPRLDLVLPTSAYSRFETLLLGTHLGLDAHVRASDRFVVGLHGVVRKDAHRLRKPALKADEAEDRPTLSEYGFRSGGSHLPGREESGRTVVVTTLNTGSEAASTVDTGLPNVSTATNMAVDLTAQLAWGFFSDVGLGWTHQWRYDQGGQANYVTGTLGLGWAKTIGEFGLETRAGIATTGPTQTPDEQTSAFPWWNFHDPGSNATVLELGLTARYR